jgi:hypothetical protein
MDDGGDAFDWHLPKQLSQTEHAPTTSAARKHLIGHPSSVALAPDSVMNGVSSIVASVSNSSIDDGQVPTDGVVNAILRFQGVIMSE